jgi:hypothetical protein
MFIGHIASSPAAVAMRRYDDDDDDKIIKRPCVHVLHVAFVFKIYLIVLLFFGFHATLRP